MVNCYINSVSSLSRKNVSKLSHVAKFSVSKRLINKPYQVRKFHQSSKLLLSDPYKTLGIDKSSSSSDIKKAYYKLAKTFHPDINKEQGAEKKFHDIQEAYEVLSDESKKAQYDQYGSAAFQDGNPGAGNFHGGNPFGGAGGGDPFGFGGFGNVNFEDLFGDAFKGGRNSGSRRSNYVTEYRGEDIEVLKNITFKEAIFGTKVKINYDGIESCGTCSGSGLKPGKKQKTCGTCHGTGQASHVVGGFHLSSTCNTCRGSGVVIDKASECNSCHGKGVQEKSKVSDIDLPSGLSDGTRIRVPGGGDAPQTTSGKNIKLTNGDLIIRIRVAKDPIFQRDDSSIIVEREVPMTTAALGGSIEVPTIDGEKLRIKISNGTQHNTIISIPEKGVPTRGSGGRGSMKVVLKVKTLRPETATQTALLEALADAFNDKTAKRMDPNWEEQSAEAKDDEIDHPSKLKRIGDFLGKVFKPKDDKN